MNAQGDDKSLICYVAAHTAVLYDCNRGKQTVLQGHCNPITCICATEVGAEVQSRP